MEEDQVLLALNLTSVGEILNQYVNTLCSVLEWKTVIEQIVRETPQSVRAGRRPDFRRVAANSWEAGDENLERHALVFFIADNLLGGLDFHRDPGQIPPIARTATFTKVFFSKIDPASFMWFTPTREVD
jgi:hypothetical protein